MLTGGIIYLTLWRRNGGDRKKKSLERERVRQDARQVEMEGRAKGNERKGRNRIKGQSWRERHIELREKRMSGLAQ